ncbi:aromatic amino acid lyase, partial [Klebsiella pneumoniae]|nr:aromatic amino acid lyase [Klebsiella pneumoniae]
LAQVRRVLYDYELVEASAESLERVEASRHAVEKIVAENKVVYGINTGFGKLSDVLIEQKDVEKLQLNLIRSHACGVGQPFP